ncbi:MAG: hypothetical protein IKM55_03350 [Bacilli bacterium]|nr:hypothetical protein [Bacilli bacterium]
MKLNNNGWGYRDMVIYTCIILLALFFVAMSISSFYDNLVEDINSDRNNQNNNNVVEENKPNSNEVDKNYYLLQESKLKEATLNYVNRYSYDLDQNIMSVSMETLVSLGFMEQIYDQTGTNKCSGYSNVYIYENDYGIVPYISCNNYVTLGY